MSSVRSGCAIASMVLVACGSGSLGSVFGHGVSTSQAIFLSAGGTNTVFLVTGDTANMCEVFTGRARPSGGATVMETLFANWNGTSVDPAVPGTYVQTVGPVSGGLVSDSVVQWGSGCVAYSAITAGSGNVQIKSFGGFQAGAHLVVDVDLKFGNDHLAGPVDAIYCGESGTVCGI